jgi:signal peptidase I
MTWKSALRENVESLIFPLILVLITRTFIFQAFKIPSESMRDTLLIGDHILVNKSLYFDPIPGTNFSLFPIRDPQRGDIMVFKFPRGPSKDYIKRLIGIGGDLVSVKRPWVMTNGQVRDEPYARWNAGQYPRGQDGDYTVPPGQYFMMGDNRDNSEDSRVWGFLQRDLIKGKAFVIYFSLDNPEYDAMVRNNSILKYPLLFWSTIRWGRTFNLLH